MQPRDTPFDEDFQDLLEKSSLGTPGAGTFRERSLAADIDAVQRIAHLRARMALADREDRVRAADDLVDLLRTLGYHRRAEAVLAECFPHQAPAAAPTPSVTSMTPRRLAGSAEPRGRTTELSRAYTAAGPTVLRMLLGGRLRQLRESRGFSRDKAGYAIRASESKIARIEVGRIGFKERDVADLLTLYGVTDEQEVKAALDLARRANMPEWWDRYTDVLPSWFQNYLGLEAAAATIRTYEVQFVPGLLQTPDYAEAVVRLGHGQAPPADIRQRVQFRIDRQQILYRDTPYAPTVHAIIDEAALRRAIGNRDVMCEQLQSLIDLTELPNVCLQILPFHASAQVAAAGAFTIVSFPDRTRTDVVYIEQLTSALYLERSDETRAYDETFTHMAAVAEAPECSAEILKKLLHETDHR